MATKAKTLQVKDKEKDDKAADAPEKDSPDAPSPLLDLSDAAVKKMIKQAKKRGFVTFDQLNEVLPSDTTSPEQIEDIMSMLSDMGINVSEAEDSDSDEETKEEAEDETDNELVEVTQKAVTEVKKSEPGERTDDPVRMYLREMGTVELLSREGEIAIAKRIEAGREAMIAGLCESPLTFQAIIIWRDELNEGKIFLRIFLAVGVLGLGDIDAHVREHRHDVLDLLRRGGVGRQDFVELIEGHEAALLGLLDHLLDGGVGKVEQRRRRVRRIFLRGVRCLVVFFLVFYLQRLCLGGHSLLLNALMQDACAAPALIN